VNDRLWLDFEEESIYVCYFFISHVGEFILNGSQNACEAYKREDRLKLFHEIAKRSY